LHDDWPAAWHQAVPAHPLPRALAQGLFFPWTLLSRWNMRHADAVSAQSRFFAERAMSQGAGDRPHICYLGTEARPTKSAPPDTPFTLLYLGSMGRFYDLETVLQAARRAKDAGKSWLWRLVGTDPNRRWQARADALGLSDKVAFPGYMQGDVLEHALASSHAALIPMDPRSQVAVPGKAATYASAGLPMISSLPGELASLLSSYDAGCTYCHGNAVDLFQKIASLAETDGQRKRQSEGARRLFADHFDAAKTYEAFADWIESTANTA